MKFCPASLLLLTLSFIIQAALVVDIVRDKMQQAKLRKARIARRVQDIVSRNLGG